jgi:hypothetical protein
MVKAEDMLGQLIHRLATSSISSTVEEENATLEEENAIEQESPIEQDSPIEQENPAFDGSPVRQWRVVSQDGVSSLFDLDLPQCDPGEPGSLGSLGSLKNTVPTNDPPKKSVAASFSVDAPSIVSRPCVATSPNIGMPSALPRTSEILQAAASTRPIETQEPRPPKTPLLSRDETPPDRVNSPVSDAAQPDIPPASQPDSSSPMAGDSGLISRSLVADAVAAAPPRFHPASRLAMLKTPAAGREIDGNLAKIITQWSSLTWPIQAAVLAMVDAAAKESQESP